MRKRLDMKLGLCTGVVDGQNDRATSGKHTPRSRRSPTMVTRSAALRRSPESMRQHKSMSLLDDQRLLRVGSERAESWTHAPEFLRLKPLAELPKERSLLSGSIVRMRRSRSLRTSSLTAISSVVGSSWTTNSKRHCEKSWMKRWRETSLRCCCGGELGVRYC